MSILSRMIEETAQYCPHCGKAVIKSKAEVTPEKEKENLSMAEEGKKVNFSRKRHLKVQLPTSRKTFRIQKTGRKCIYPRKEGFLAAPFCSLAAPACDGRHHFRCLFLRSSRGGSFSLIGLIMQITLGVRRLHDLGHSGLWAIIFCIPVLYFVILLALFFMKGDAGDNAYGPKTK